MSCSPPENITRWENLSDYQTNQCGQRTMPPSSFGICQGKPFRWMEPLTKTRILQESFALKHGMNISSCQEFCSVTKECQAAVLRDNGLCELMTMNGTIRSHAQSTLLTYQCCEQGEEESCISPTNKEHELICPNGYIQWLPPLDGSYTVGQYLAGKIHQNITSCQEFCYTTPGCAAANFRKNGHCMLMATLSRTLCHEEMILLTFQCCETVHGGWSQWSEFTSCQNESKVMTRNRECNNPSPFAGGGKCQGESLNVKSCDVHGGWSEWSEFSNCSTRINVRTRSRKCNNPPPSGHGPYCVGDSFDHQLCSETSTESLLFHYIGYSYTAEMRERAANEKLHWNLKPILCSLDGEFLINWNDMGGSEDWVEEWRLIVSSGSGFMGSYLMMPEQGNGAIIGMKLWRYRSDYLIKTRVSNINEISASSIIFNLEIKFIFYKDDGETEIILVNDKQLKIPDDTDEEFMTIKSLNWGSFHKRKPPIFVIKLLKIETK